MRKRRPILSDLDIRAAEPRAKPYKLFDPAVRGLYVLVHPNGSKYWLFNYTFAGRRNSVSVGKPWPDTGLAAAREEARNLRALIAKGIDPAEERRRQRLGLMEQRTRTFAVAAESWYEYRCEEWKPATREQIRAYLDKDILPALGARPLDLIETAELADLLKRIRARGAKDVAKKARAWIKSIFTHARAEGLTKNAPDRDLGALLLRHTAHNYPHIDFDHLPELLHRLDAENVSPLIKTATWLALWTANRPGVIRTLKWSELDLDNALWKIEKGREGMKRGYSHLTPLPRQAVEALQALRAVTGKHEYVFPNRNDPRRPMSDMAVNRLLKRIGFGGRQTAHGFRHLISTALNERGYESDWVERQLAHGDPDKIRGTYNKAHYLEPRRKMMQEWADVLDRMRAGTGHNVVSIKPGSNG